MVPQGYINKAIRKLRKAKQKLKYLFHFLTVTPTTLDARPKILQGANRRYRKFIILAHQRSGSTLLIGVLRKHPQIVGFGELFNENRVMFSIKGYTNSSVKSFALRNKYPVEFLDRHVFSSYRDDIRAVGFKLFPDQIDKDRFRCIWKWLEEHRDLKIIHLTRQDLLATYTSLLIAKKDGRFLIKDESERTKTTITIDPNKCLAEFQKRKEYNEEIRQGIKYHQVLEVTYEDLAMDPHGYLRQVQKFLGVDICDLEINHIKQETRPLSAVINNYGELRQNFIQTEWEYLFNRP